MAAIWHESPWSSIFAPAPSFSFHELAQVVALEPYSYRQARQEMELRQTQLGPQWFITNAEQAHDAWEKKKPWYCHL